MLRTLKALLLLTLAGFAAVAAADPPDRVGRLNLVSGPVSFAPGEAPDEWVQAPLNRPITAGDRLWADRDGRAELHVGSTAIRLAPLTNVDVLNLDDRTLQVRLGQGAVNVRVRELDRDETVEVATPTGAVLIRQPGSYRISADPQSAVSRVLVNFGQADIVTPSQTVTVPSSQSAVVAANAPVSFEIAAYASPDEFDRWSMERDRREDRVASTRYVSRDMTGYEDLDQYGAWQTYPEYGAVWIPRSVAPGWAPYRNGHWAWVSPWGWTWVDDAPWGFAPFHYGRWVQVGGGWGWAPGPVVRRPVYAPALVAFVGGSGFSVSARSGPAVGWFPLGWREPYTPWYRSSPTYVRNVNVHVTNVTNVTNITYVNRNRPEAVTVVPQQAFVSARPVAQSHLTVHREDLARAQVLRDRPPAEPVRASLAPERRGERPPREAAAREVVSVTAPAAPAAREGFRDRGAGFTPRGDDEPRVRVLTRDRDRDRGRAGPAQVERANVPVERANAPADRSAPANAPPVSQPRTPGPSANVSPAPPTQPGTSAPAPRGVMSAPAQRPAPPRPPEGAAAAQQAGAPARPPEPRAENAPRPSFEREGERRDAGSRQEPPREAQRDRAPERVQDSPREAPRPRPQTEAPAPRPQVAQQRPEPPRAPPQQRQDEARQQEARQHEARQQQARQQQEARQQEARQHEQRQQQRQERPPQERPQRERERERERPAT